MKKSKQRPLFDHLLIGIWDLGFGDKLGIAYWDWNGQLGAPYIKFESGTFLNSVTSVMSRCWAFKWRENKRNRFNLRMEWPENHNNTKEGENDFISMSLQCHKQYFHGLVL